MTSGTARTSSTAPAPGASRRPSAGGRPTREAAAQLERRILDVAASLFAAQGYAATSMEQVAEHCQAGKDTIYRRYPSKSALFSALLDRLRTQTHAELLACMPRHTDPLRQLQAYARALLDINLRADLLALHRVALGEAVSAKGVEPPPAAEDPFMQGLAGWVQQAQAQGKLAAGDPAFIAGQLLYATSIQPLLSTMLGGARYERPEDRQAYFDQAWALFLQGAAGTLPATAQA
ncbi:TetR/AcrR family transcriptional regulator [Bordetella genomosp. 12]|uniref:HTH tetR-type domain-containing protein n=1 Tax=Bordetella genomosp. 12 TaxID=463035 RepID=A0A261VL11_9BORD|nr:TetR/AcrR family transcriptional regulator [Bordetella genomosp. 12]OZI74826.1 hypothetical protein CAL22_10295 [Bordetella genomosp. 12]